MKDLSWIRNISFEIDDYLVRFIPPSQLYRLPPWASRFLGYRSSQYQDVGNVLVWLWSFVGAFGAIALVAGVFKASDSIQHYAPPVMFASLGAAAMLHFNAIGSPLAQPRNALCGQIISAVVGVTITKLFKYRDDFDDVRWLAGAVATGAASFAMGATNSIYPPGGATALVAAVDMKVEALGWMLVPLITLGTVLMLLLALLVNNIQRRFPLYWFTSRQAGRRKITTVVAPSAMSNASRRDEQIIEQIKDCSEVKIDMQDVVILKNEQIAIPEDYGVDPEDVSMVIIVKRRDGDEKAASSSGDIV